MILRRLIANFGALSRASLELTPGLNVIEAPNEAGKSTWCAFLRVMLYGPESRRGGKATRADKELYAPWDGSAMEGAVDLAWEGKNVTLRRTTGPAGPMRAFSAVYTGSNQPVSALSESDVGETLTGLSAEVFRRTAFIGPAGLRVDSGPEMEKYIALTVASGEEGTSFTEAAERLKIWQRRYRSRGQGRLVEQENDLRRLDDDLQELSSVERELEETERREERVSATYSELTDQLDAAARDNTRSHREYTEELLALREEYARRKQESESIRAALRASPLADAGGEETLLDKARADSRRCEKLLRQKQGANASRLWPACLLLACLCAVAGFFHPIFFLPAAVLLGEGGYLWVQRRRALASEQRRNRELTAMRKRYGVATPEGILSAARTYCAQMQELRSIRAAAEELRSRAKALAPRAASAPEGASGDRLAAAGEELRSLSAQKARLNARRDALGTRRDLQERRDALRAQHEADTRTYAALEIALRELTAADEERQASSAPALARRTKAYFRALTGGNYETVALDRGLSAAVRRFGDTLPHDELFLSRGTRDQLYLALRLALCEQSDCPLILDDALVRFDDERMGCAMELFRELSQTRQILLFTCQHRERRYLETHPAASGMD